MQGERGKKTERGLKVGEHRTTLPQTGNSSSGESLGTGLESMSINGLEKSRRYVKIIIEMLFRKMVRRR